MHMTIDSNLIERLIDCIAHQSILKDQPEDLQNKWQVVIDNTVQDAIRLLPQQPNLHVSDRKDVGQGAIISPDKTSFV